MLISSDKKMLLFSKDIFFQNLIDVTQTFMYIHI